MKPLCVAELEDHTPCFQPTQITAPIPICSECISRHQEGRKVRLTPAARTLSAETQASASREVFVLLDRISRDAVRSEQRRPLPDWGKIKPH